VSTNPDFKVISSYGGVPELFSVSMTSKNKNMTQGPDKEEQKEREDEQEKEDSNDEKETKEHYEDMVDDALLGVMDDIDEEEE
jgi:hypothetical protein